MTVLDKLLIAIIKNYDEKTLAKINPEWLDDTEISRFNYLLDYYRDNGELMGIETFCSKFKLDSCKVDSRPSVYLRELKERYIFTEISENIPTLLRKLKDNPKNVLEKITELASKLNSYSSTSRDTRYSDDVDERLKRYKERRANKGVVYLSMGHEVLDRIFRGYGKVDLITFAGRAGSKKTWLMVYLAFLCEQVLPDDMGDILFITNEITSEALKERMDAVRFKLSWSAFLDGTLTRKEQAEYFSKLKKLTHSRIIFIENVSTIVEVQEKIALYKPAITFIDGSYLLEKNLRLQEWERIQKITRGLKAITLNPIHQAPIVNTTQMTRGSGKKASKTSFDAQDEFAFGSSYVQDSDVAIRMYADKEMLYRNEIGMQIAKGRNIDTLITPIFLCNLNKPEFDFLLQDDTDNIIVNSHETDLEY